MRIIPICGSGRSRQRADHRSMVSVSCRLQFSAIRGDVTAHVERSSLAHSEAEDPGAVVLSPPRSR